MVNRTGDAGCSRWARVPLIHSQFAAPSSQFPVHQLRRVAVIPGTRRNASWSHLERAGPLTPNGQCSRIAVLHQDDRKNEIKSRTYAWRVIFSVRQNSIGTLQTLNPPEWRIAEVPMSVRYDELVPALKRLLPDEQIEFIGRSVAFIRRLRAVSACAFVWSVVLSRFGSGKPGFEQARQWYARLTSKLLWPRPFQVRFKSPATVRMFERAFDQAVTPWRSRQRARHPLARHVPEIIAWDSTVVQVADQLRRLFKGTRAAAASLKVVLGVSVWGLVPLFARIVPGNRHDMVLGPELAAFRKGSLLLMDKGFSCYERLRTLASGGLYYLCPMRLNGNAQIVAVHHAPAFVRRAVRRNPEGLFLRDVLPRKKRIGYAWDLDVLVRPQANATDRTWIRTRLVIVPGPEQEQHPYLTNLPVASWTPALLRELYRLRWQVELVFKELKQSLNLESVPTKDPDAVQVFIWASLIALAVSRAVASWLTPLARLTGLASELRPAVLTRALRANVRLLARAMLQPTGRAIESLRLLAEDLLAEARQLNPSREDSLCRIPPLLSQASA